ncbi:RnfABCDGE type electron transport complex subunit B [Sphaerotilus mobilis]|uniref:RnfABCDGE type electron transport complex subunit B n=1 Tax=Sphaerotilus mobilis TaxID=47994 RepID=UPI00102B7196|nr:RnfABCDGE type electron transport complex subunit B [Sphaerotilus mobilis]
MSRPVFTIAQVDAALPQTQCTRCGEPDCHGYAEAIVAGRAAINRCPPGGAQGVQRLAEITGQAAVPLDPACGHEGPRTVAWIDERWCIGCTLCIKACPVDCIVGSHKRMHTVVEADCTGCELCIPACPVDCIQLDVVTPGRSGWSAWSDEAAATARRLYLERQARRERLKARHAQALQAKAEHKLAHVETLTRDAHGEELARKRAVIQAALARARAQRKPDPT